MSRKTMENILDFWIATEFFKPFSIPIRNSKNEDAFFNANNINLGKYLYKDLDDVRRNPYKQVFIIYDDWDDIYNNQLKDLKNYAKENYGHFINESYHYKLKDDDIQLIVGEISYQSLLEAASEIELLENLEIIEPLFALCYHLDDYNNYVMTDFSFKMNTMLWYLYCQLVEKDIRDYRKFMSEIEYEINRKKLNYLNASHLLTEYILNNYIYPVLKAFNLVALNYDKQLILCLINNEFRESKHYIENFTYLDSSFYIRDLEAIKNDIEKVDKESIFYQYTMGITNKDHHKTRVDVRTNNKRIIEMLDNDNMPYASWPKDYDLYLLQQFAVNAFVSNKSDNLIAVNGPAGTGKTTLLKDVFAQIIYEKAMFIGQHKDDVFSKKKFNSKILYQDCFSSKKYNYYYKTHSKLNNFSILVASSNNGAVQNITHELPIDENVINSFEKFTKKRIFDFSKVKVKNKELGEKYSKYIDSGYYSLLPSFLLDEESNKDNNNGNYWGLISAAVGNRENIRTFNSTLIYQGLFGYLNNNEITKENPDEIYSQLLENESKINNVVKNADRSSIKNIYEDFEGIKRKTQFDRKELQKRNPYQHIILKGLREKSFVLALDYIKSFVLTSPEVRHNLHLWKNYFEDDVYYRLNEQVVYGFDESDKSEIYLSLLNTVFLIVPILSTTFASVGSMLKYIPKSSLGYLIIDEAGQAVPQSAAGALYRHQRAMIVGDPKQVPPVVLTAEDMLKEKLPLPVNDVFKDNPINRLSVQVLADHACKYGTYYGSRWMGSPLLIHRRCPSPIFDMFNELSYEGFLYNETKSSDYTIDRNESIFIDIKGKSKGNKNHYVHEHLVYMNQHIDEILMNDSTIQLKDIFVITPFTTVRDGIVKNVKLESVQEDLISSWKKTNVGTVHTFQGKEAKIVFLILGCDDSSDSKGAINWVTENIFNVALSRAKERMIIISDPNAWKINKSYCHIRKTFMNMKSEK